MVTRREYLEGFSDILNSSDQYSTKIVNLVAHLLDSIDIHSPGNWSNISRIPKALNTPIRELCAGRDFVIGYIRSGNYDYTNVNVRYLIQFGLEEDSNKFTDLTMMLYYEGGYRGTVDLLTGQMQEYTPTL